MGACIGKKSSKYSKTKQSQSDKIQAPQIIVQDENVKRRSSPSLSEIIPGSNDPSVNENHDDQYRESKIEQISINSELQLIIDEQDKINEVFCQPISKRIVLTTDAELELELARFALEQLENDHTNTSLNIPLDNSTVTK